MNIKKMDLNNTFYFQNVVRYGSFAKAAEAMGETVAQVKKNVSQFEKDLDSVLFKPESEGRVLTAAGLYFYDKMDSQFTSFNEIVAKTKNISSEKDLKLSVAISDMIGASAYGELIKRFAIEHPEIDLTLSVPYWSDMRRKLIDGSLDIALTYSGGLTEEPIFIRKPIFRANPNIVYSQKLFEEGKEPKSLKDFKELAFVTYNKSVMIAEVRKVLQYEPKNLFIVDSLKTLQLYVQSGLACAICGPSQQLSEMPGIGKFEISSALNAMGADLVLDKSNRNPAIKLFLDCADKVFGLKE